MIDREHILAAANAAMTRVIAETGTLSRVQAAEIIIGTLSPEVRDFLVRALLLSVMQDEMSKREHP